MKMTFLSASVAALVLGSAARAQEPAKPAATPDPAATTPAAPAATAVPEKTATPPKKEASSDRPYVDAAITFLKGFAQSQRGGEAGETGWALAKENGAPKVALKVAGKEMEIDVAGAKSPDAHLMRFQKISTLRDGATVKGVTVEKVDMKIGNDAHTGKATVLMEEKDGKWIVTSIEVE
jgi:hypothetical protein